MIYIDSNLFIYARIDKGKIGEQTRKIISLLESGKIEACTSVLSLDEVVWIVREELKDYKAGIDCGRMIMEIPNLIVLDITKAEILKAFDLMENGLKPRDALHAATCLKHGVFTIVTNDSDFKKLDSLNTLNFVEFLKENK
ncbi:MAG: type II toxin-antitoxin system VapC family toxin [Candidatus Aenigmarchaeota archaeon]|nr:type II toxin-antitoxin system VapC family toxin [Candidatus Aenigmarchaeota archaeon]